MSKRRYFGHAALAVASTLVLAACSSDTATTPTVSQSLTEAAPTIAARFPYWFNWLVLPRTLCYPARYYSTRGGCPSSVPLYISNTGGGSLNWTSTKSATWIKRSPKYGTAPDTMTVWVDGTGLPTGTYYGWIKLWATGATNSPLKVYIKMQR